jgi:hypothetical protein
MNGWCIAVFPLPAIHPPPTNSPGAVDGMLSDQGRQSVEEVRKEPPKLARKELFQSIVWFRVAENSLLEM